MLIGWAASQPLYACCCFVWPEKDLYRDTGQRQYSTIAQLRVEQFKEALQREKPVLLVEPIQDKIRMAPYVPLHP